MSPRPKFQTWRWLAATLLVVSLMLSSLGITTPVKARATRAETAGSQSEDRGGQPAPQQIESFGDLPPGLASSIAQTLADDLPDHFYLQTIEDGYQADNPAHDLTTIFTPAGLQMTIGDQTWGLALTGLGRDGVVQAVGEPVQTIADGTRIEYRYLGLSERYLNTHWGLEQGFTLRTRPAGSGDLTLELALSGNLQTGLQDDTTLQLTDETGQTVARYTGLYVYDAKGHQLPAHISLSSHSVSIVIDDSAAAYPLAAGHWMQQTKLLSSDDDLYDQRFGYSVAISGDTVVIGAYGDSENGDKSGAAYIFERPGDGWSGTLNQSAKLMPSDGGWRDYFGRSVAISGDTVVVGAYNEYDQSGAAYIFERPAGGWSGVLNQSVKLLPDGGAAWEEFGWSVAISSDASAVAVGAPGDGIYGYSSGSVYIFERPPGGWTSALSQSAKLTADDGASEDCFGCSVAISSGTVVVGAYRDDYNAGSAYVFVEPAGGWSGELNQTAKLIPNDSAAGDEFGASVSISGDAGTVAIGAPGDDDKERGSGSVYVYVRPGGGWSGVPSETAKLLASDGAEYDHLGNSVSISGGTVLGGASGAGNNGAAYVFVEPGDGWSGVLNQSVKLRASDGWWGGGIFGYSVAISGGTAVVGAYGDDDNGYNAGAAYVFAAVDWPFWNQIVFESFRDMNWEIYKYSDDGSSQIRLTNHDGSDIHPRLNPGCTRIAFVSSRAGNYEIYTMHPDGSGLTRLTANDVSDVYPFWSPDGTQIVFQSYRNDQAEIYVMNADGSGRTRLTNHGEYDGQPVWSPDGSQIAFISRRTGRYRVWVMNADGSGLKQMSSQAYSANPVWSPDGSQIAYDADGNGDGWTELWLLDVESSYQRQVYDPPQGQTDAYARSWSPNGRYLAFSRVSWIYYQGNWYWTESYLDAWDSQTEDTVRLGTRGMDWRPDWQTADPWAPTSSVNALPPQSPAAFDVSWFGSDEGPSGLLNYDVQFRDGAEDVWTDWHMATTQTSAAYTGPGGHTYYFRARARDNAGNVEAWPSDYDAMTTVETLAPQTSVNPLPTYHKGDLEVSWKGTDPGGSGIESYDVQYREADAPSWTDWQMGTTQTSASFSGTPGHTYHFRSRATDYAQNVEDWPPGDGDAFTTFYNWALSGVARDNRHTPLEGMVASTQPKALQAVPSSGDGAYVAYVGEPRQTYTAIWAKNGYGDLPDTVFDGAEDASLDVVMPPANNLVRNGGFESGDFEGWVTGGAVPPAVTDTIKHTGSYAASLGWQDQAGDSSIAQAITLPITMSNPTLSFLYQLGGVAGSGDNRFEVWIDNGTAAVPLFSADSDAGDWTHLWFDVSPWAGQSITLTFNLHQQAGQPNAWAYLDEVSVGSAYPDLWVSQEASALTAAPDEQVVYTVAYGNRGGVPASGVYLTASLPAGLHFVDASPPPISGTLFWVREWTVGDLSAQSEPFTIVLTTTVAPTATLLDTLTTTARIRAASPELETTNDVAQVGVFIGHQVYLPILMKEI